MIKHGDHEDIYSTSALLKTHEFNLTTAMDTINMNMVATDSYTLWKTVVIGGRISKLFNTAE